MKQFYLLSTLLYALAISNPVSAQITIDEIKTDPSERILKNEVRPTTVDAQSYFSCARYRAERAAIRKERNTLEFGGGILGSVTSYSDSWIETSGGDNSIGLAATLFLHHTFTKQRFTIETKFDAKFGYNRMNIEVAGDGGSTTSEGTWYKNQDEFQISTNPAYIINKSWQVGSIIKFRSQFRYRTTLFSFIGWLSNLNMKNRYTSVSAYEKALQTWSDAQGVGDKPMLQIHPTVRWENTIDIKATKYLTTTFNFQLYYNRAQNYDIQTQLLLSVGLTYTFKNK